MNKFALFLLAATVTLAPQVVHAKSVFTLISMNTFKSRCLAAGGTLSNVPGGIKCKLPSGASVSCYDTDGPGISCDYRTVAGGRVRGLIQSSEEVGTISPQPGSGDGQGGAGNTTGGRAPSGETKGPGGGEIEG